MSGARRDHLSPVPDPLDEVVLDWLRQPESASSRQVLDAAFAQLPTVSRQRPWPWDRLIVPLRPEPFGTGQRQLVLVAAVVALLAALFAGLVATGGINPKAPLGVVVSIAPESVAPEPTARVAASFPLAADRLQFVINDGSGSLSVINSDGSGLRLVSGDVAGALVWPDWRPGTDTVLALQGTFEGTEQIWAIDTTNQRRSQVIIPCVSPCASRNEAAVSHDGSKVLFFQAWGEPANGVPPSCSLQLYDVASQVISPVTDHACGPLEERHPRFSPDDTDIAFWRGAPLSPAASGESGDSADTGESAVFVRDLSSGAERQVTPWATHASHLDWSPDGGSITFVPDASSDQPGNRDVWRIRVDGSGLERLTDASLSTGRLFRPIYTPDGDWILFMHVDNGQGRLLAVPAEGGATIDVLPGINVLEYDVRAVR